MKNITQKNQYLVMSPSFLITEASLLDIFANLSPMMNSSEYATSLLTQQKGLQRHRKRGM